MSKNELITDRDWAAIDGEICRVTKFEPLARIVGGRIVKAGWLTPYALVHLESPNLTRNSVAKITHKRDFVNLWAAFVDGQLTSAEEVNIAWIKSQVRGAARLLSRFMPGLSVMICKAGAFELITDPNCQPELTGEARFKAEMPIVQITPDVLL
jgi:hypothetical protein